MSRKMTIKMSGTTKSKKKKYLWRFRSRFFLSASVKKCFQSCLVIWRHDNAILQTLMTLVKQSHHQIHCVFQLNGRGRAAAKFSVTCCPVTSLEKPTFRVRWWFMKLEKMEVCQFLLYGTYYILFSKRVKSAATAKRSMGIMMLCLIKANNYWHLMTHLSCN